jgi:hypothetical protein
MKRTLLGLATAAVAGLTIVVPAGAAHASGDYGPDTCLEGYVWREARSTDHVCVTGAVRSQAWADNAARASRWVSGAYGPHTCVYGYVWREAFSGDDVCVYPSVRTQAWADNAAAANRKVSARLWITKYTIPPHDNGDGTSTSTSTDDIARLKLNGDHYNFAQVKLYVVYNNGHVFWSGSVTASAHTGYAGGSWGKKTGVFDCSRPGLAANGYAQAYDVISTRWSPRVPVRIGCAVL